MGAALPDINKVGRCEPCSGKRPEKYKYFQKQTFKQSLSKKNFKCNSKMVVYLIECRVCRK